MKFLLMKHPPLLITLPSSPNSPIFIFIIKKKKKNKLNLALSKAIEKVFFFFNWLWSYKCHEGSLLSHVQLVLLENTALIQGKSQRKMLQWGHQRQHPCDFPKANLTGPYNNENRFLMQ